MSEHQKDAQDLDTAMASVHLSQRREARFSIPFPIEVTGVTRNGQPFHEKTATVNVSEWGCGFISSVELRADDMILVRRILPESQEAPRSPRQAFFQVVRVEPNEGGWLIGAWKMDTADVWGAELVSLAKPNDGQLESRKPSPAQEPSTSAENKEQ